MDKKTAPPVTLRAKWVFPVCGPPLENGVVTIGGGRILAVGNKTDAGNVVDLGDVAITPGFVNAHTHLEFSGLNAPLGHAGIPFVDWIRQVMAFRQTQTGDWKQQALAKGIQECIAGGVTTVADIASSPWLPDVGSAMLDGVDFLEILGGSPQRYEPLWQGACKLLQADQNARLGLSPHAPYSTHIELLERAAQWAEKEAVPLAMHLAETVEEAELLASHSGPLLEFLLDLEVWRPDAAPRGIRFLDYLEFLARAPWSLVVHGNVLDDQEIQFLAQRRRQMALVHCPRTHVFFQRGPFPLREWLEAGVHIAIGTDSRASNPDLHMLGELQTLADLHPDIAPRRLLRLVTQDSAAALRREQHLGSLTPGRRADLAVLVLPNHASDDPHELLWESPGVLETWRHGLRCPATEN